MSTYAAYSESRATRADSRNLRASSTDHGLTARLAWHRDPHQRRDVLGDQLLVDRVPESGSEHVASNLDHEGGRKPPTAALASTAALPPTSAPTRGCWTRSA